MSLVHNEQTKLTATWLNTLGTASMTVGVLAPLASVFYGFTGAAIDRAALATGFGLWLFAGLSLHLAGRLVLKVLKP